LLNTILGSFSSGVAASTSSYESIASATGTGSSGTITFSSIVGTYKHLQVRWMGQVDGGTTGTYNTYIQFNSDSGNNYARHTLEGNGASATASGADTVTAPQVGLATRNSDTALGVSIIDIQDYASTTKYKTVKVFNGADRNGAGSVQLQSGLWMSTSAISSISIINFNGNFKTNSTFALYGIKG
jgi:hypothetical protein